MSYLYIAKFKDRPNSFKVGVAKNYKTRLANLQRTHGELNHETTSIIETSDKKIAQKIESILHFSFKKYKDMTIDNCDGYTEFLKNECFNDLLDFIDAHIINGIDVHKRLKFKDLNIESKKTTHNKIELTYETKRNIFNVFVIDKVMLLGDYYSLFSDEFRNTSNKREYLFPLVGEYYGRINTADYKNRENLYDDLLVLTDKNGVEFKDDNSREWEAVIKSMDYIMINFNKRFHKNHKKVIKGIRKQEKERKLRSGYSKRKKNSIRV